MIFIKINFEQKKPTDTIHVICKAKPHPYCQWAIRGPGENNVLQETTTFDEWPTKFYAPEWAYEIKVVYTTIKNNQKTEQIDLWHAEGRDTYLLPTDPYQRSYHRFGPRAFKKNILLQLQQYQMTLDQMDLYKELRDMNLDVADTFQEEINRTSFWGMFEIVDEKQRKGGPR